ncbi:MAG TPA: DOPA 4,5-dioxygenase family protein [Dongiaceae bacterium]|jgi:DOPA 4,5-dioxygenase
MTNAHATPLPVSAITSYHAHIYYDLGEARERAERLRTLIGERFVARIGAWHDELVGPHLKPMYQVAFAVELFPRIVPWLMLNRMGLSILVHPNTRRPRDDHLVNPLWLGEALPLKGEILPVEVGPEKVEELPPPNTSPTLQP